jgi:hypothetical protein
MLGKNKLSLGSHILFLHQENECTPEANAQGQCHAERALRDQIKMNSALDAVDLLVALVPLVAV